MKGDDMVLPGHCERARPPGHPHRGARARERRAAGGTGEGTRGLEGADPHCGGAAEAREEGQAPGASLSPGIGEEGQEAGRAEAGARRGVPGAARPRRRVGGGEARRLPMLRGGRFSTSRSCFSTSSTCPKSGCTCCRFSPREAGVVGAASTCAARTLGRCRRREGQQPSQWGPRPRRWWWS